MYHAFYFEGTPKMKVGDRPWTKHEGKDVLILIFKKELPLPEDGYAAHHSEPLVISFSVLQDGAFTGHKFAGVIDKEDHCINCVPDDGQSAWITLTRLRSEGAYVKPQEVLMAE